MMVVFFFVVLILLIIAVSAIRQAHSNRIRVGTVEKIDLTFGPGGGHQRITIDGKVWAMFLDYKEWPKVGQQVRFKPLNETPALYSERCINILEKL